MQLRGLRIKEERERLGLKQVHLARLGGVTPRSQCKYEKGQQEIRAAYLAKLAEVGIDVLYVLTGIRSQVSVNVKEQQLLAQYRRLSPQTRRFVESGMLAVSTLQTLQKKQNGEVE